MARLIIKKHFSFTFLGKGWEDGYIDFQPFTANDIKGNSGITIDAKNPDLKAAQDSFDSMIMLLESRFISGKFPTDDGKLEDIKKEELGTLPIDIIQEAITFLSQSQPPTSSKPSENS